MYRPIEPSQCQIIDGSVPIGQFEPPVSQLTALGWQAQGHPLWSILHTSETRPNPLTRSLSVGTVCWPVLFLFFYIHLTSPYFLRIFSCLEVSIRVRRHSADASFSYFEHLLRLALTFQCGNMDAFILWSTCRSRNKPVALWSLERGRILQRLNRLQLTGVGDVRRSNSHWCQSN